MTKVIITICRSPRCPWCLSSLGPSTARCLPREMTKVIITICCSPRYPYYLSSFGPSTARCLSSQRNDEGNNNMLQSSVSMLSVFL